jgi:hypothetical protein
MEAPAIGNLVQSGHCQVASISVIFPRSILPFTFNGICRKW